VQNIWAQIQADKELIRYFPSYSKSRHPNRAYLLNVINTVRPHSLTKAMKDVHNKRGKKNMEGGERIEITNDYLKFLNAY